MTQLENDKAVGFLFLMLEKTRYDSGNPCILSEAWAAATMAKLCGLVTQSSHDRIVRYLDNRDFEMKENY